MRALPFLFSAVTVTATSVLAASCQAPPAVELGLTMLAPEGLLDTAKNVQLSVFDAEGHACDPQTGNAGDIPADAKSYPLVQGQCGAGTWCRDDIKLPQDGSSKMFYVDVTNDTGRLAQGCATAAIDQDPLEVDIKVVRFVPPACCGNGVLETGELCDTGGSSSCGGITASEVCAADCSAAEIPLDVKAGAPAHAAGDETSVSLAFGSGTGQLANSLRATFQDKAAGSANVPDVDVRFLKSDLTSVTSPGLLAGPLRIPVSCASPGGVGEARNQQEARIATIGGSNSIVVYTSNKALPSSFDVFYVLVGASGCADDPPTQLNGVAGNSSHPGVAEGPGGTALFVWSQGGEIKSRVLDASGTLGAETTVATGKDARVAGTPSGWIVVYEGAGAGDDDGIFTKPVSSSGTVGSEKLVNLKTGGTQDQADIATQDDGSAVVVFHSEGDVYFQRFDAAGAAVADDQQAPIHAVTDGEQANPAASAGTAAFFTVAWEDGGGTIRARYIGTKSGFVFNDVDGQNGDFLASAASITGDRHRPSIAYGGDGYVVVGWDDQSSSHPGVFARRFPTPQAQ